MKKVSFAAVLISVLLLLSSCAMSPEQIADLIGGDSNQTVTEPVESMDLAFSAKLPLDPFQQSSGLNGQIAKLSFEPLFGLDEELRTYGLLAKGVEKVSDTEYLIALNPARVFWDNTGVTVPDVLYSFKKAKKSKNFASLLSGILSMSEDNGRIRVALSAPDVFFMNNLSFPVIKASSDTEVVFAEGQEISEIDKLKYNYVGTGLYIPFFGEAVTLKLNSRHPRAEKASVKTITLVEMPDFEAMTYSLDAGVVDMIYSDLSGGLSPIISGNLRPVSQNHLVYLGVSPSGATSDWQVRKAISLSLNRSNIVAFYSGYAKETGTPFHPAWYGAKGKECVNLQSNSQEAAQLVSTLKTSGANTALTLAVNSDNTLRVRIANEIARQLTSTGFSCTVTQLPYASYNSAVVYGGYNLYLGELRMPNNFSMSNLLKKGQKSFGITVSDGLITSLDSFYQTGDPTAFLTGFNEELPFIPLCYRSGMAGFSANYTVPVQTSFDFAFSDIEQTAQNTIKPISTETVSYDSDVTASN